MSLPLRPGTGSRCGRTLWRRGSFGSATSAYTMTWVKGLIRSSSCGRRDQGPKPRHHRWGGDGSMKSIELQQATQPLADYTRELRDEPLVLTVNGRPVAAL